jgi:hypothetical protein
MEVHNMNTDIPFAVLVERKASFIPPDGSPPIEILAQVGYPYWTIPGVEAACPVALVGTVGRVPDIRGIDPMSALKIAIEFVYTYLDDHESVRDESSDTPQESP